MRMWALIFESPLISSAVLCFASSDGPEPVQRLLHFPGFFFSTADVSACRSLAAFSGLEEFALFSPLFSSLVFLPSSTCWSPGGGEDIPEGPRLSETLSRANQPAQDSREERERVGRGGGQSGRGEEENTVSVVWTSGGLGSSGGGAVRVSCAALCAATASSKQPLSSPSS